MVLHLGGIPQLIYHLPVGGHLSYFQFLAAVNKAAMNSVCMCVYTHAFISLRQIPRGGLAPSEEGNVQCVRNCQTVLVRNIQFTLH